MERKLDFLTGHALTSRLKAYYTLLPTGYVDTLVGMAIAGTGANPSDAEHFRAGLVAKEVSGSV